MTVTAEMYRSRVADVLNLTTDNDRLRSELQRITDIAKASTTANSLPNIAKIASDALAGASVPAPQPPVEGLREALKEAIDVFEGMNDDEINEELLPRLKAALFDFTPAHLPTGREHDLKTWPEFFEEVIAGRKTFEVRHNDRDYKVGDILWLREWSVTTGEYSGRETRRLVTYVMSGRCGVEKDTIIMALASPSLTAEPSSELRRAWLDKLNAIAPAVENLAGHQEQCDFDGVMVKVSRQALDEVLNAINDLAVSFVTAPATLMEQSDSEKT